MSYGLSSARTWNDLRLSWVDLGLTWLDLCVTWPDLSNLAKKPQRFLHLSGVDGGSQ